MEDEMIINLFNRRDEAAIHETSLKYRSYCLKIALNILRNKQDADECINDVLMRAWNVIPPQKPRILSAFLGKITRNLSVNRYNLNTALKRGGGEITLIFDELEQSVPILNSSNSSDTENEFDAKETGLIINTFLKLQSRENRAVFVRRYFYADSMQEIAEKFGMNQNTVKTVLHRMRGKLKNHLEKEGVII
jgi:RNA polymerase sigma-70 factor (ECF subfamily)